MVARKNVKIGELVMTTKPRELAIRGLGSSLGVIVFDDKTTHFAVAHPALPDYASYKNEEYLADSSMPARFVDLTVRLISRKFKKLGIPPSKLSAKIVGGCTLPHEKDSRLGKDNLLVARKTFREEEIRVESEFCGGSEGISIQAIEADGSLKIRKSRTTVTI